MPKQLLYIHILIVMRLVLGMGQILHLLIKLILVFCLFLKKLKGDMLHELPKIHSLIVTSFLSDFQIQLIIWEIIPSKTQKLGSLLHLDLY